MYISIERNSRGNLEINERILSKIIKLDVTSNAVGFRDVEVSINIYQEKNFFVFVKIFTIEKGIFNMDGLKVVSIINDSIYKILKTKPKNIAIAFLK